MIAREFLDEVLNPEVLSEIVDKYSSNSLVKTLVNNNVEEGAKYSMVRVERINSEEYILCPVLDLFDEELNNEVGFAVSVDQDYFDVYAYECNHNKGKYKVLSKLPHCVHKSVTLEGSDYSKVSESVKKTANIDSAILFINNYLTDQAIGLDSPIELFDNKLYQQLINRLTIHGNNKKAVSLRLDALLKNYDYLDENDPMYENNLNRANVHLINFLFGCEDNINNKGFIKMIKPEQIKKHIQKIYDTLFKKGWIFEVKRLIEISGIQPKKETIQKYYDSFLKRGLISSAKRLRRMSGIKPHSPVIEDEKYLI
ncbi:hypothetical protein GF352_02075 [archaeon]|nr:hypothetical protein [archaeon]